MHTGLVVSQVGGQSSTWLCACSHTARQAQLSLWHSVWLSSFQIMMLLSMTFIGGLAELPLNTTLRGELDSRITYTPLASAGNPAPYTFKGLLTRYARLHRQRRGPGSGVR